jgi:hypothetical protein
MSKLTKQLKDSGEFTFKGPQVKERKKFAPATKVENPKKGKGSYKRKDDDEEDEQGIGEVPMKRKPTPHEEIGINLRKKSHTKPSIDYSKLGTVPLRREKPPLNRIQKMDRDLKKRNRNPEEDNQEKKSCWKGYKKKGMKTKGGKRVNNCVKENVSQDNIVNFIDSILSKNYASANKYIKQAVESKIQTKIEQELSTPLF